MIHSRLAVFVFCGALAAPVLSSSAAFADPAPADDGVLTRHRELFARGNALYDSGKLHEAEAVYREAWALKRTFDVAGNLGNVELDLGKARDAAEHIAFAIREFPAGGKAEARETMLKRLGEARQLVGALRLHVNKPGAEITVDGVARGPSPISEELFVEPGTHTIEARLEGYPSVRLAVAVERGTQREVSVELRRRSPNRTVLATGGAVAGAAAVAGVVFTIVATGKASDASREHDSLARAGGCGKVADAASASASCQDLQGAIRDRATFSNAAVVSFVGAGLVGAGTVTYGLMAPKLGKTGVRVLPLVTAESAGVVLGGAF